MHTDRAIEEIMMGMVREKAAEIYSEALIEHGTNPRNYGPIENPDGYAKVTGPLRRYRRDVRPDAKRRG